METIIKVSPSELNLKLLNKIRKFIGDNEHMSITISLTNPQTFTRKLSITLLNLLKGN